MPIFGSKRKSLHGIELQTVINLQHNFYMPMDLNAAHFNKKVIAIDNLNHILSSCVRKELHECDFEELLLSALTLVYHFGMRLKLSRLTSKYWYWCGKRQFHKAEAAFKKTMDMLLPECSEITIKLTLKFFTDVSLWPFESFVSQILEVILYFIRGKTTLFNLMLTDIHCVLFNNVKSARHRMRVFYDLLNSSNWVIDKQKLLPFVTRLLDFFAHSIAKDENRIAAYNYLRKGFEVCLHRIFERVNNQHRMMIIITMLNWFWIVSMNHENVLEFATLLYHAVDYYEVGLYKDSLKGELIEHVLKRLASSPEISYGLVGCRLLLRFLDRGKNSNYLNAPVLFYDFSQAPITIGSCDSSDKAFIREHREMIQDCLIKGVQYHSTNISYVKHVYSIICAIVLEVPCGLTAAASACMLMEIQEKALNAEKIPPSSRYWMHALVVSVMSLICWVHKAPVLYTYVKQIIARRAQEAPQLNPPIMNYYTVTRHHVTWNKPTLFFEDWELRYALWKHFQLNEILFCLAALLTVLVANTEGRKKKVVIHVPYKVKKMRHTHTVYKTIHHHHTYDHGTSPSDEHEHFHHMYSHEEQPISAHSQPIADIGIPEFLPDAPIDHGLEMPDILPHELLGIPNRHFQSFSTIPLYRQH